MQYPHEKEAPPIRARGVIALREDNCTVCMLCARSCPDWCIYIEGHKEKAPPRRPGGKPRTVSALDRFDIDYALCMYCGICVEVCPFDALFWSPEYEYSEPQHRRPAPRQGQARRVDGDRARGPRARSRRRQEGQECSRRVTSPRTSPSASSPRVMIVGRPARRHDATTSCTPRCGWSSCSAGAAAQYILLAAEFVAVTQVLVYIGAVMVLFLFGTMLTRAQIGRERDLNNTDWPARRPRGAACCSALLAYVLIDAFGDDELPDRPGHPAPTQSVSDSIFGAVPVPFWALSFVLLAAVDRRHRPGPEGLRPC